MKKTLLASAIILALAATPTVFAKGKPPPSVEASNNLSFPVIVSDNVATLPLDGAWRFATITNPLAECIGEAGVVPGTSVDPSYLCYYGRKVIVSETGISFEGEPKVWWLNKRVQNFWKALSVGHDITSPLVVTAVDIGDLLESSPELQTRQIRSEFNLLQKVAVDDPEFGQFVVPVQDCMVPTAALENTGCFGAVAMSGAVPGTEQSGNEMQGTDFGPGTAPNPGTRTFVDPATVRTITYADGTIEGVQALVYSRCARLVIQKIAGTPIWDRTKGQWSGSGVGAPVVNIATYRDEYTPEITSGGGIVYGYNWNARSEATGTYRFTFVLDGNDAEGPACTTVLGTKFEMPVTGSAGTKLVNVGEANKSGTIIYAGDSQLGDEGGLVYIDVPLTTKGGGGRR